MKAQNAKYEELKRYIETKGKNGVVIAFSGGVDSSTLAAVSHSILGDRVVAVTAKSPTYTTEELEEAKKVAKEIGIKLYIVETGELSNENFNKNPENRCYYCKKELLERLQKIANELGFKVVFEGTNFSDLTDHRPGFKAVKEMKNVYSPWVDTRFTKEEIRAIAREMKLSIQNKPPLACLASRIPYHEQITAEKLNRIEKAEQAVKKITGAQQLRVRDHSGLARIEVGKDERSLFCAVEILDRIVNDLKRIGFKYVTLDLEGYRPGSMLLTLDAAEYHR
ncbi:MAG: ATP-dependent sacrificial sulfur transferase LarE [Candidatus Bathyarchaeota archaeon]|nr:ATP-dependent sacrificial sulfur transferase LarE [Candidatus Bathyarchaeota archaeon]